MFLLVSFGFAHAASPEPLDLPGLLAEVERANPELAARAARSAAAAEVSSQRRALPDPRLSMSYTNDSLSSFTLGESPFSNVAVRWDQDVPNRRARAGQATVAEKEHAMAVASESSGRARLRARTIALYVAIWRAEHLGSVLEDGRALLTTTVEAARVDYESGRGTQQAVLAAQTDLRRLEVERELLARARRAAEIALGETLGRAADARFGPAGELPSASPFDPGALEEAAAQGSPEAIEIVAGAARADAAVESARAQTKPEWGWMAAYQYLGSLDPMVMGGLTVRLPLWKDSKQARAVAEAEHGAVAAQRDRDSVEVAARARVRDLVSEIDSLDRRRRLYDEAIVPEGSATFEAARAAFSAGQVPMSVVLDDLGKLLDDRRAGIELAAERVAALSSLELATGFRLLGGGR